MAQTWQMYAHRFDDHPRRDVVYEHFGVLRYVQLYGLKNPIVQVELTEDPEGAYWGWIDMEADELSMIQPHQSMFEIQFPYGSKAEADRDNGRVVRLSVRELDPA